MDELIDTMIDDVIDHKVTKTEFTFSSRHISKEQERKISLLALKYFNIDDVDFKQSFKRGIVTVIMHEDVNVMSNAFINFKAEVRELTRR